MNTAAKKTFTMLLDVTKHFTTEVELDEETLTDCLTEMDEWNELTDEQKESFWVTVRADREAIQTEMREHRATHDYDGDEDDGWDDYAKDDYLQWEGVPSWMEDIIRGRFKKWLAESERQEGLIAKRRAERVAELAAARDAAIAAAIARYEGEMREVGDE